MALCIRIAVLALFLSASASAQFTIAYSFYGTTSGDELGRSVARAGDVNGDGYADLIFGAPLNDANGNASGLARVISGFDGSILYTFMGNVPVIEMGNSVDGVGDLNGDGYDDVIVSMQNASPNGQYSGRARVYSGLDGSTLFNFDGAVANARFGHQVSGAGDVNGDGTPDVIIAASYSDTLTDPSRAFVYSGANGALLYTVISPANLSFFGNQVRGAGDLNGDGCGEFMVSAPMINGPNGSKAGAVFVYSGIDGSLLYRLDGESNGDYFGDGLNGIGDLDGDNVNDIIVGAPRDDLNGLTVEAGSVRIFSGATGAPLLTFWGDGSNQEFGYSVDEAGDVNLDGFPDIIVGAWKDSTFGTEGGSATVFSGADGSVLFKAYGDNAVDHYGSSVCGIGDTNGDGTSDIAVGAIWDDNLGTNSGSVRLYRAPAVSLVPIGGGQPNTPSGTLLVNNVPTGNLAGPFQSGITRGQYFSLDLRGAPLAFYEVYGSYTLNPGGWDFPGFGLFDLGTGPNFSDVFILFSGFQGSFPYFALDNLGQSHQSFFVQPFLVPGTYIHIQAVVQNAQPWQNGIWSTITAAHTLTVQ